MKVIEILSHSQASNTYIIESDEAAIIVDCGATLDEVKKHLTKPVAAILLSHGHFDHIFELEAYYRSFECLIYGGQNIINKLLKCEKNLSKDFCERLVEVPPEITQRVVEVGEQKLNVKDIEICCITLPGHSECGMGYLIDKCLFCGDTLFEKCVGRYDLYDSSFKSLRESLRKINGLNVEHFYPGHGRSFTQ